MSLFNPADLMLPDPESCASRFVVSPWMLMSPEPERTKSDSVAMSSLILNLPEPDKTNLLVNAFNLSTKMLPIHFVSQLRLQILTKDRYKH